MSYNQYGNRICLDCGKMKLFDSENQYISYNNIDDNCPKCGKIILNA